MNSATYDGVAVLHNRTDERDIRRIYMKGTIELDIPLGDGKATVGATKGFKTWYSTREAGLTVESTVSINFHCDRKHDVVAAGADLAGGLAQELAENGLKQLGFRLEELSGEVTHGLSKQILEGSKKEPEEPVRRSEKSRPGKYDNLPRRR